MTAIPELKFSNVATSMHHTVTSGTVASAALILKPTLSITSGNAISSGFAYNSSTGLFTLDSSRSYLIESELMCYATGAGAFRVMHGFTDSSGTEITTDSARGRIAGTQVSSYYSTYDTTSDETAYAVFDGATVGSFYWRVLSVDGSYNIELDQLSAPGWSGYAISRSRITIHEY